ncbi:MULTISPECIES: Fpg/Nei family DNA glycosylase [Streptomyces]|uniref:DNA-(apurinic or apyrimidinic site) lyase n=1 Tax=Streptomyces morookaense TaxID=1970 RepID=A0A7Y7E8B1_STRMO|nr:MULTISPECIES: Fpg/Nei family DNA glycosylase [Streptomyces]MCC2280059.1 DNA glycosylase [Streptomyces sp. ET3-23]NVK79860.1 Fpg/Nei family DNA glycosylase [Streptomyces morookaense]GHF52661.1 putative endonuclease 8 2 [Streptomyces morookaense]
MPEGDTVWRTARDLHQALAGGLLTRCDLRVPALATADLTGRRITEVVPRGKHLLARAEGGLTLHSHLGMDGSWRIHAPGERWRGGPEHQIRAVLGTAAAVAVGYRLPVLDLLRTADEAGVVGHLGPDLLGPGWDAAEAVRRLLADPARTVGDAVLDQRNLAGIGNVYKSELCFLLRISPWLPVAQLPSPERLTTLAKKLLEVNKARTARITTADPRPDHRLWVYGRAGRPCRRCGTPVRGAEQGKAGQERPTYWCPRCQEGPAPDGPNG